MKAIMISDFGFQLVIHHQVLHLRHGHREGQTRGKWITDSVAQPQRLSSVKQMVNFSEWFTQMTSDSNRTCNSISANFKLCSKVRILGGEGGSWRVSQLAQTSAILWASVNRTASTALQMSLIANSEVKFQINYQRKTFQFNRPVDEIFQPLPVHLTIFRPLVEDHGWRCNEFDANLGFWGKLNQCQWEKEHSAPCQLSSWRSACTAKQQTLFCFEIAIKTELTAK